MILATVCSEVAKLLFASLFVIGSRYCVGFATPPGPAANIAVERVACAAVERLTTTSYSLAKRFVSSAVRIDESAFDPAWLPNTGLANPEIGIGPADVTFN